MANFIGGLDLTTLEQAISDYQDALEAIPGPGAATGPEQLLQTLLARDHVARELEKVSSAPATAVTVLYELDKELKKTALKLDGLVDRKKFAEWRQSIHPLKSPWWWSLDEQAAAAEQPSPLWAIPAAILFTFSISVLAETITTLRNGGINAVSVFGTLLQTLLALLAGSAFLTGGREWLENLFSHLGINRKFRGRSRVELAFLVLLITLGIRLLLPDLVARFRNYQGDQSLAAEQYFSAVREYQQAVALKPDFKEAQYNLAVAYDKTHDYAKAISQYELSINSNPGNYPAYNNVARLYILHSKDYDRALRSLDVLRNSYADLDVDDRYHLHKNSGWAYLELRNHRQAGDELKWALKQRDGAAAHYLWGRVLDEQTAKEEERQSLKAMARQEWNSFIKAIQDNPKREEIEPKWKVHAQEQLARGVENEKKTSP